MHPSCSATPTAQRRGQGAVRTGRTAQRRAMRRSAGALEARSVFVVIVHDNWSRWRTLRTLLRTPHDLCNPRHTRRQTRSSAGCCRGTGNMAKTCDNDSNKELHTVTQPSLALPSAVEASGSTAERSPCSKQASERGCKSTQSPAKRTHRHSDTRSITVG